MNDVVTCLLPGFEEDRATAGLLGAGQRLANNLGVQQHIVVAGETEPDVLARLATFGDRVVVASNAGLSEDQPEVCLAVLQTACAELEPAAVLLGSSLRAQEITPRLAHRLHGSSAGDAQSLDVADGVIRVTRPVYGGKAVAVLAMHAQPAVVSVRDRAFAPPELRPTAGEIITKEITLTGDVARHLEATRVVARNAETDSGIRLEDARVIVSGGRGLGGAEPFEQLRQLATQIGAELAASRAACDAGWIAHSHQVGQTGKKVAPQLYLAVAISGASQHMMGIADAKVIAAINTDPDAPIFKHCQFGLVEDYRNVIGPLREKLAALLS